MNILIRFAGRSWPLYRMVPVVVVGFALAGCGGDEAAAPPQAPAAPIGQAADAGPDDAAAGPAQAAPKGRVIILGFDGVDPGLVESMWADGELPHLATLRDTGTFQPLASSNPPQSPTAWSSFLTCKNPGNHGIYDFLRRIPSRYVPAVGFGQLVDATYGPDGSLRTGARFENNRQGDSFWAVADDMGMRCKILSVPFAYPADTLEQGCMLAGLGVPDIRGTTSTFFLLSDSFTPEQLDQDLSGGVRVPLAFDGDVAQVDIPGLRAPGSRDFVTVGLSVRADRQAGTVDIALPDQTVTLEENAWTGWLEWAFAVTEQVSVRAISRFHALEVGEQVRLYMTCLQFDPRAPYAPISSPETYAAELADRYGLFKTIGWIYDTHALRQDALTEALFLDDVAQTMAWRERLTLDELDRGDFDLLVAAWTATDRVSHLFWHHRDPEHPLHTAEGAEAYGEAIEDTYRKMDAIVGECLARLGEDDLFMVMSDHGFHSFRHGFNVNTWLIRNGYLAVKGQTDPATAYDDQGFLLNYDWSRTRAYSLGLGSIFLNLEGREGEGIVAPAEADALIEEIRAKLLEVTHPETGERIFRAIYTRNDYDGIAEADAPDLQLGYAEGYQSTKEAAKGAAPRELFTPNLDKWSGEHAASDVAFTPGILFVNRPLSANDPALIDLGVTALNYLGVPVPADFEGRDLL